MAKPKRKMTLPAKYRRKLSPIPGVAHYKGTKTCFSDALKFFPGIVKAHGPEFANAARRSFKICHGLYGNSRLPHACVQNRQPDGNGVTCIERNYVDGVLHYTATTQEEFYAVIVDPITIVRYTWDEALRLYRERSSCGPWKENHIRRMNGPANTWFDSTTSIGAIPHSVIAIV